MHISAGKLDGADLRSRELWTIGMSSKSFKMINFAKMEVPGPVQLPNSDLNLSLRQQCFKICSSAQLSVSGSFEGLLLNSAELGEFSR